MATNLMSSPSVLVIYSFVKRVTNLVSSHVSIRFPNFIISNIPINLLNGWHLLFLLFMQTLVSAVVLQYHSRLKFNIHFIILSMLGACSCHNY